jgi:hypothetical protein
MIPLSCGILLILGSFQQTNPFPAKVGSSPVVAKTAPATTNYGSGYSDSLSICYTSVCIIVAQC